MRVDDAEVVEDLHGAGLEALAPERRTPGALQDQRVHPAPGQVDTEGEAGGAGADDQHVRVQDMRIHDIHGNLLNDVKSRVGSRMDLTPLRLSGREYAHRRPTADGSRTRR
ncbi:hypothetical protein STENM327S_00451 [Streptomyces tendae]